MADILIIEDDSFLRNICARHLRRDGRTIRVARDGEQGIAEIERRQPDVLLLDLLLPRVDGFSVLETIRDRQYAFPVIVLSNIDWSFGSGGPRTIGVTEYFIKSNIDIPELIERVEQYLPKEAISEKR